MMTSANTWKNIDKGSALVFSCYGYENIFSIEFKICACFNFNTKI